MSQKPPEDSVDLAADEGRQRFRFVNQHVNRVPPLDIVEDNSDDGLRLSVAVDRAQGFAQFLECFPHGTKLGKIS